ncbi:MSCRAMM family protein [Occallatibacter savannae]|uniref:MSCRAMM family protein n=1 Tax=Occallatibacter savannae TaxID=1002691 RepID=UPI000D69DD41|nr:hypothetical protein [Occallatibacter savannae]
MERLQLLWIAVPLVLLAGCEKRSNKPDPTKGVVSGLVICADTAKPARFATVNLTPIPQIHSEPNDDPPLAPVATIQTGLDGRFRMEAVPPGEYYAFGTLDGYLDPMRGLDFGQISAKGTTSEQEWAAVKQWKENLTAVKVAVRRVSEITIQLRRAAEIEGTVSFDDGSPAIGMRFQLFRKNANKEWGPVGLPLFNNWAIDTTSDSHGHYAVENLAAGEYIVCALMPIDSEDIAPRVCLGNVLRRKAANSIKVSEGEVEHGADIVIPVSGLRTVGGRVEAVEDGHAPSHATVTLLYADDHEQARTASIDNDGSFRFEYVPEDSYVLRVGGAKDDAEEGTGRGERLYLEKEMPLRVHSDVNDVNILLTRSPAHN